MKKFTRLLQMLLLVAFAQTTFGQLNGTYSIGTAGIVPSETGNYASLSAAITALNTNGVSGPCTFYFTNSGTYTEASDIAIGYTGGSATNTVTFKPYTGVTCTVSLTKTTNSGVTNSIDGNISIGSPTAVNTNLVSTNYLTIDGSNTINGTTKDLTIQNTTGSTTKSVIRIFGDNDHITIKNCIINSNCTSSSTNGPINVTNWFAVTNYTPDYLAIQNNTLNSTAGNGSIGINISVSTGTPTTGLTNLIIDNNVINAKASRAIFFNYVNDATISNNTIDHNPSGLSGSPTAAILLLNGVGTPGTINIFNNTFTTLNTANSGTPGASILGEVGIDNQLASPKIVNIYNNVIRGFKINSASVTNVTLYGIRHTSSSTTNAYNNSIYLPELTNMTAFGTSYISGIAFASSATTEISPIGVMNAKNNAIFMDESSMKTYGIKRVGTSGTFTSNNNIVFINATNPSKYFGYFNATDYTTLADWQAASSQDGASYYANPNYTSATNLLPTTGYPGAYLASVLTDITGATRDNAPTIGAYEAATMIGGVWKSTAPNSGWNNAVNWRDNTVPTAGTDIFIPSSSTNWPSLGTTHGAFNIWNYGTINLTGLGFLQVTGNFVNNGIINCEDDGVGLTGSSAQKIYGNGTVGILNILNSNGVSISTSTDDTVKVSKDLKLSTGVLTTNGRLIIKSDASGSGRISNISSGISGNTIIETYIPSGRRAYRFLGHPFAAAQSMSSLTDDIFVTGDGTVTGLGGASPGSGFDATGSNAASSWWFDNTTNAWKAFTTASATSWTQYGGARVLVRGDRTQTATLTGGADVPNAVTLDITGAINTGNQNISLPTAGNYHFVSNPYPSPTNIGAVIDALGTGVLGTLYWVWDPQAATKGAYVPKTVGGGAYSIPMSSAFIVRPISSTTLAFTEANKTASATAGNSYFRTNSKGNMQLQLLYNDYPADYFMLNLNEKSAVNKDEKDGEKLMNSDMNFYSLTTDGKKLSLDTRPLDQEDVVKLAISTNVKTSYKIKVASFGIENTEVYLKDNYTHSITKLGAGVEYSFEVTTEAASQGASRFELVMKASPVALPTSTLEVKMSPNPVKDVLTVSYSNPTEAIATVRIINSKGQILQTQSLGNTAAGNQAINMAKYSKGVYTVELTIGKERISKQVVKN